MQDIIIVLISIVGALMIMKYFSNQADKEKLWCMRNDGLSDSQIKNLIGKKEFERISKLK